MGIRFSNSKLLIILISLTVMGCVKKDWNCHCTVNGDDYTTTIPNSPKSKAGKSCGDCGKRIGSQYASYVYKCKVN
jgi:hypothetical protein